MPSATSSTFHFYRVSWAALDLIVTRPIHAMHSLFRSQPFSSSNFLRHVCIPIFSLSVHLICHLLHAPSVIQFFFVFLQHLHTLLSSHSMLCILCALRCTSCHSSFLLLWGILASPYFHILCISCGYVHKHHCSTTASASKPLNLSFLHVPLSFFQLSVSIATFIFLSSVILYQSLLLLVIPLVCHHLSTPSITIYCLTSFFAFPTDHIHSLSIILIHITALLIRP